MVRLVWPPLEEIRMNIRYRVELSEAERDELTTMLSGGKHAVRKLKRAQILRAADAGAGDEEIARSVGVGGSTISVTWRRRSAKNRVLERTVSCRAKRKPSWWRRHVPARPRAAPVGPSSCWRVNWSG